MSTRERSFGVPWYSYMSFGEGHTCAMVPKGQPRL